MDIKRDSYLQQLISYRFDGLVKVITGIRRCGKSFLIKNMYKDYLLQDGVKEEQILSNLYCISFSLYLQQKRLSNHVDWVAFVLVFTDDKDGYYYGIYGYMNVETKAFYAKDSVQVEVTANARVETIEQMDSNLVAMEKDIKEILRLSGEQRRLWEAYEKR